MGEGEDDSAPLPEEDPDGEASESRNGTEKKRSPVEGNEEKKSALDKIEQVAKIFATVLIPIVIATGGWWIQGII